MSSGPIDPNLLLQLQTSGAFPTSASLSATAAAAAAAAAPVDPQTTPTGRLSRTMADKTLTHPRWEVDAARRLGGEKKGGGISAPALCLSLSVSVRVPAFPCSGEQQPFSVSAAPIAEPSRAVRLPRGLRNTEPLIARGRRGGRQT